MDEVSAHYAIATGSWLLVYRLVIETRCGQVIAKITRFCAGSSLILIVPLTSRPAETWIRDILFGVGGGVLAVLGQALSDMPAPTFASVALGMGLVSWFWRFFLCSTLSAHPWTLWLRGFSLLIGGFISQVIFTCTAEAPALIPLVLFPMVGALLVVVGYTSLEGRSEYNPFLETCSSSSALAESFGVWIALFCLGFTVQAAMRIRQARKKAEKEGGQPGQSNSLLASLVQNTDDTQKEGFNAPKPGGDGVTSRVALITRCIPEGSDMSDLTENEKKLVEICRTDSFERDRILWGGGLC